MLLIEALYNILSATSFMFPTFLRRDEQCFLNLQTFVSINLAAYSSYTFHFVRL